MVGYSDLFGYFFLLLKLIVLGSFLQFHLDLNGLLEILALRYGSDDRVKSVSTFFSK
jgi:hypothetical protein